MKYLFLLILFLYSCQVEPEFWKNGKPYYTSKKCIRDSTWTEFGYYYDMMKGEYTYGMESHSLCLEYGFDTIEIKNYVKKSGRYNANR